MHHHFTPVGVCAKGIDFDLVDGKVYNVRFERGCDGNLKAIGKLVEGMEVTRVAEILAGNTCGRKDTSCADQLAKALLESDE